jgi:hypothetical protein
LASKDPPLLLLLPLLLPVCSSLTTCPISHMLLAAVVSQRTIVAATTSLYQTPAALLLDCSDCCPALLLLLPVLVLVLVLVLPCSVCCPMLLLPLLVLLLLPPPGVNSRGSSVARTSTFAIAPTRRSCLGNMSGSFMPRIIAAGSFTLSIAAAKLSKLPQLQSNICCCAGDAGVPSGSTRTPETAIATCNACAGHCMRMHTVHLRAVSSSEAMKGACCPRAALLDWLSLDLLLLLLPLSFCVAAANGSTSGTCAAIIAAQLTRTSLIS